MKMFITTNNIEPRFVQHPSLYHDIGNLPPSTTLFEQISNFQSDYQEERTNIRMMPVRAPH